MTALGVDRRILRAFYTQYIAVLLIVLVFFVAAFQAPRISQANDAALIVRDSTRPLPLGSPITLNLLTSGHGIDLQNSQLRAIVDLLRAHDLQATFVFDLATNPSEISSADLSVISLRVDALERFFAQQGLPRGVTQYLIEQSEVPQKDSIRLLFRNQGRTRD